MRKWISAALIVLIASATAGCSSAPGGTSSATRVVETASPDEAGAIRFRTSFGLRSDPAWVRSVAADPAASIREFGVPLMPAEIAELNARAANQEAVLDVIRAYVDEHRDESGGLYIDQEQGGAVTTLWTANLEGHAAAIRALVRPGSRIAFRGAAFTEEELSVLHDRVSADLDWMRGVGIAPLGVSDDVVGNRVEVLVSSADPDAPAIVAAHYGAPPGMLVVISDGTGAALIPIVTVRGRVVSSEGGAPGANGYTIHADPQAGRHCDGDISGVAHGIAEDGSFEVPCQVGTWTFRVTEIVPGVGVVEYGSAELVVEAPGPVELVVLLGQPQVTEPYVGD